METDCFFRMGSTHAVCQDYAAAGASSYGGVRAAVSDGCSTAADSDWGARFLVQAAMTERWLDRFTVMSAAQRMQRAAALPRRSLQATLLVASVAGYGGELTTYRAGDGVIVTRTRAGHVTYEQVEFDANMPAYLAYSTDANDVEQYKRLCRWRTTTIGERDSSGGWVRRRIGGESPDVSGRTEVFERSSDFDLVLLLSDGVESFQDPSGDVVSLETVLDELLAFKSFKGQFIGRRCGAFLARTCAERGWKHADDFSVAGIYLGP